MVVQALVPAEAAGILFTTNPLTGARDQAIINAVYMNLSVAASLAAALGVNLRRFAEMTEEVFGRIPNGLEIPVARLSCWCVLRMLLVTIRVLRRVRTNQKRLPAMRSLASRARPALWRAGHG